MSPASKVLPSRYRHRFPISEVIEAGPRMDRSTALTAIKVAGVRPQPLLLARRVDHRAVRTGEMDDQPGIGAHSPMMP